MKQPTIIIGAVQPMWSIGMNMMICWLSLFIMLLTAPADVCVIPAAERRVVFLIMLRISEDRTSRPSSMLFCWDQCTQTPWRATLTDITSASKHPVIRASAQEGSSEPSSQSSSFSSRFTMAYKHRGPTNLSSSEMPKTTPQLRKRGAISFHTTAVSFRFSLGFFFSSSHNSSIVAHMSPELVWKGQRSDNSSLPLRYPVAIRVSRYPKLTADKHDAFVA